MIEKEKEDKLTSFQEELDEECNGSGTFIRSSFINEDGKLCVEYHGSPYDQSRKIHELKRKYDIEVCEVKRNSDNMPIVFYDVYK